MLLALLLSAAAGDDAARFYGVDLPKGHAIHFALVTRPKAQSRVVHATQLENWLVIEVPEGAKPEERVDVVFHELFHYFYASAPKAKHIAAMEALKKQKSANVFALYTLFDEAFATALGNGLVQKRVTPDAFANAMTKPRSFYNDDAIDTAAKAIVPELEKALPKRASFDAMATTLADRMAAALGAQVSTVALALRSVAVLYEGESTRALRKKLMLGVRSVSVASIAPIETETAREFMRHADRNGVIFVIGDEIKKLAALEPWFGGPILKRLNELAAALDTLLDLFVAHDETFTGVGLSDD